MTKLLALLWALVVLVCSFWSSSLLAQNFATGANCPNLYAGDATAYTVPSGVAYSNTVICNQNTLQQLAGSNILNEVIPNGTDGNPIGQYNPLTDTFTFNNNSTGNVTASASFAINAALQAAGIGVRFRGFKYEWELFKPEASSTFKLRVTIYSNTDEGLVGSGKIYQSEHNYKGQAFQSFTALNDGGNGTPPFSFTIKDEWTVEAQVTNSDSDNEIRGLKYTWTYNPVVGHENDFDPNFVYPGQQPPDTDFDILCNIDPQSSPACPNFKDKNTEDFDGVQDADDLREEEEEDYQEELAELGVSDITGVISDSALQTGTNIDGSLSNRIIDLGIEKDHNMGGEDLIDLSTGIIVIDDPDRMPGLVEDIEASNPGAIIMSTDELDRMLSEDLIELDTLIDDLPEIMEIEIVEIHDQSIRVLDMPDRSMPLLPNDLINDELSKALEDTGAIIIDLPDAEILAIEEMTHNIKVQDVLEAPEGAIILLEESLELEAELEGRPDIAEVSDKGEVSTSLDGTLNTIPREEFVPEEIELTEDTITDVIGETDTVSATGTISSTTIKKPSLTSIQRQALSIAATTTTTATNIAQSQALQSTSSGLSQVTSGSSDAATGNSGSSGSSGSTVMQNDGSILNSNDGSQSGNDIANNGSQSGGFVNNNNSSGNNFNTNRENNSQGTSNQNFNTSTNQSTIFSQTNTSPSGDVDITSLTTNNNIASLNQSGPSGVFVSDGSTGTNTNSGQTEINEEQLALGGTVTYEETNDQMFGTTVIPQLDFTVREMIDNIIKRTIEDAGMAPDLGLDEVSEEDLKEQQDLEDQLVQDAIAGSNTEDAQSALLGYNPTFRDYVTPQVYGQVTNFYMPKEIYPMQTNWDNPNARFFNGASDVLHRRMVRQQYGE